MTIGPEYDQDNLFQQDIKTTSDIPPISQGQDSADFNTVSSSSLDQGSSGAQTSPPDGKQQSDAKEQEPCSYTNWTERIVSAKMPTTFSHENKPYYRIGSKVYLMTGDMMGDVELDNTQTRDLVRGLSYESSKGRNSAVNYQAPAVDSGKSHSLVASNGLLEHYDGDGNLIGSYPYTTGLHGVTDPSVHDKGPLPPGTYTLDPVEASKGGLLRSITGDWGTYRAPLTPCDGTNTYGRSGFYLHGGTKPGSLGCMDIGNQDTVLFPKLIEYDRPIRLTVK